MTQIIPELAYLRSLANREPLDRKDYELPIIFSAQTEHIHSWCNSGISIQGIPLLVCTTCGQTKRINI